MNLYYNKIIDIIEKDINKLCDKYYSKNIFNIIHRRTYKLYINKYYDILLNCYKNIEKMMMKETINNNILELTNQEYKQLSVFNGLELYEKNYKQLTKKNKLFTKSDVLWAVYNELALKYEYLKDYPTLSIVLERQTDILINEKKYTQALNLYLCSLYCLFYNYEIITNSEIDIFDRHLNKRRKKKLNELIKINNMENLYDNFQSIIINYMPSLYNEKKAKDIINKILRRLKI